MIIPTQDSAIVQSSGNLVTTTDNSSYTQWILDSADWQSQPPRWKDEKKEQVQDVPFTFKINLLKEATTKGDWNNFRTTIAIPNRLKDKITLLNASFLGGFFGGFFHGLQSYLKTSGKDTELSWARHATSWANMVPDPPSMPAHYHYSNISFVLTNGRNVSISSMEDKAKQVHSLFSYAIDIAEKHKSIITVRPFSNALLLQIALAEIFTAKQISVIEKENSFTGSDTAWVNDMFAVENGDLSMSLFNAQYTPYIQILQSQPTPASLQFTTATGRTANSSSSSSNVPLVGCRSCFSFVNSIWSKSVKKVVRLLFNPEGLVFAPTGQQTGVNCILDCIHYFLQTLDTHDSQVHREKMHVDTTEAPPTFDRAYRFTRSPEYSQFVSKFIRLDETINTLAEVAKIVIVVNIVRESKDFSSSLPNESFRIGTEIYNKPIGKYPNQPNLYLLVYASNTSQTAWHAVVISTPELNQLARCRSCHQWYNYVGRHFENCIKCKDCGIPHQKDGKHYLSCKGRQQWRPKGNHYVPVAPDIDQAPGTPATLVVKKMQRKESQLTQHVHFADFECFQDKYGHHWPYLICFKTCKLDNIKIFSGKNCLDEFINHLHRSSVVGYLYFHNGAGYDVNLVITGLLQNRTFRDRHRTTPLTILRRGTKVLSVEIKTKPVSLKCRDFYLIINKSLAQMNVDFKTPDSIAKMLDFDHSLIKSYEDAQTHLELCTKYVTNDVLSLEYCYQKVSTTLWTIVPGIILPEQMSLASQALEMWKKTEDAALITQLVLPKDMEDYNIFRAMYHGGRVLATVAKYDSSYYTVYFSPDMNPWREPDLISNRTVDEVEEIVKTFRANTRNYKSPLKMLDVVSLYPAVMEKYKFPCGDYKHHSTIKETLKTHRAKKMQSIITGGKSCILPVDESYLGFGTASTCFGTPITTSGTTSATSNVDNSSASHAFINKEYDVLKEKMFRSCYQVDIDADADFIIAFLMRKTEDPQTGVQKPEQTLAPLRNHWVTGVELFEAIRIGYKLLRVHSRITWEKCEYLFKKYITLLFKIKEDNKHDKNSSLYIMAKVCHFLQCLRLRYGLWCLLNTINGMGATGELGSFKIAYNMVVDTYFLAFDECTIWQVWAKDCEECGQGVIEDA